MDVYALPDAATCDQAIFPSPKKKKIAWSQFTDAVLDLLTSRAFEREARASESSQKIKRTTLRKSNAVSTETQMKKTCLRQNMIMN